MNIIFKLILSLIFCFLLALNMGQGMMTGAEDAHEQPMPFKLGFEFQESSHLCEWALRDERIQKKPLYQFFDSSSTNANSESLLHIVLDGADIEFVTRPFSSLPEERSHLERCISLVKHAFTVLADLLTAQNQITFQAWIEAIVRHADWPV